MNLEAEKLNEPQDQPLLIADVTGSGCDHDWRRMIELTANIDECRKCGIQQSNHLP